jgi:hypothetical protein
MTAQKMVHSTTIAYIDRVSGFTCANTYAIWLGNDVMIQLRTLEEINLIADQLDKAVEYISKLKEKEETSE